MGITKAKVVDLRSFDINKIDKGAIFALDTNALYWMHYSRCSMAKNIGYQLKVYPNVISELIKNGNKLVTTIYNITELLYIIERNELEIYRLTDPAINKKAFRDIHTARASVKNELEAVMLQVKNIYEVKEFNIDILGIEDFLSDFASHNCDDFDYLVVKYLRANGVTNIITDDCDLVTMDAVTLLTANNIIINRARAENLLI